MTIKYDFTAAPAGKLWAIDTAKNDGTNWVDEDSTSGGTWRLVDDALGSHPELTTGKLLVEVGALRYAVASAADIPYLLDTIADNVDY